MSVDNFIKVSRFLDQHVYQSLSDIIIEYTKYCLWEYDPNPEMFVRPHRDLVTYSSWSKFKSDPVTANILYKIDNPQNPLIVLGWVWKRTKVADNFFYVYYFSDLLGRNVIASILVCDDDEPDIRQFLLKYNKLL